MRFLESEMPNLLVPIRSSDWMHPWRLGLHLVVSWEGGEKEVVVAGWVPSLVEFGFTGQTGEA